MSAVVVAFAVAVALFVAAPADASLHASCHITFTFTNTTCDVVNNGIVDAFKKLSTTDCPPGTEKCLYTLDSATETRVTGKHATPKKHYKDDISFDFAASSSGGGCVVKAFSTSETWYAVLDSGTNACNILNLQAAAGFSELAEVSTSDSVCTQWSSRNCDKY